MVLSAGSVVWASLQRRLFYVLENGARAELANILRSLTDLVKAVQVTLYVQRTIYCKTPAVVKMGITKIRNF